MKAFVDIHSHLLPGIDDGSRSMEETRAMLEMEYKDGVRSIIVTPHYRIGMFEPPMELVRCQFEKVSALAAEVGDGIALYLGCEYHSSSQMADDLLAGRRPALAGSAYVLTEFSAGDSFRAARRQVYALVEQGYRPVLAHIERYPFLEDMEHVGALIDLGAYMQVNAGSILGEEGFQVRRYCRKLMKQDYIQFVGTDAHRQDSRKPNLGKCAQYVEKKMGTAYVEHLFCVNPLRILGI